MLYIRPQGGGGEDGGKAEYTLVFPAKLKLKPGQILAQLTN